MSLVFTIVIIILIYFLYKYQKYKKHLVWINNNIKFKEYKPFDFSFEIFTKPIFQINYEDFLKFGSIYGCFRGGKASLCLNELDLIKKVFIKESSSFVNRAEFKTNHPILDSMLFVAKDDQWKRLRSIMSPTFTKTKIKNMLPLFNQCAKNTCAELNKLVENDVQFDLKVLWGKYTADSIGKCCFAVNIDLDQNVNNLKVSNKELTTSSSNNLSAYESQFIKNMNKMVHIPMLLFILFVNLPKFIRNNLCGFNFFPNKSIDYFRKLIECIVKCRKSLKNKKVNDFLQFLFEHNDEYLDSLEEPINKPALRLSSDEIVAQCLIFMIGGYDTTKTLLSWLCYRLTIHQNMQEKVYEEIVDFLNKDCHGNLEEVTIDNLDKLQYLNALIQETLRFYPPLTLIERVAERDVYLKELDMTIKKGMEVSVSIYNMHHDPKYFPEPEMFIPERWLTDEYLNENNEKLKSIDKKYNQILDDELINRVRKLNKEAYIPFGLSFRSCIGRNFALVDAKLVLTHVLPKFKFISGSKTTTKPRCKPSLTFIHSDDLIVKVAKRQKFV